MYELKKIGKLFTSKFVGTGPSSYKKIIYRAAVSQTLVEKHWSRWCEIETFVRNTSVGVLLIYRIV
jgi:hypothetical protein